MAITIGTHLGSVQITALLGRGGFGEVYRARDMKLKRDVAIKILPEEFSRDPDRVSRFQREAEVLASRNGDASRSLTVMSRVGRKMSHAGQKVSRLGRRLSNAGFVQCQNLPPKGTPGLKEGTRCQNQR